MGVGRQRKIRWGIAGVIMSVTVVALGAQQYNARAGGSEWGNLVRTNTEATTPLPVSQEACPTLPRSVVLRGSTTNVVACVFGNDTATRVARYINSDGVITYAIAFSLDDTFTVIRGLCSGMVRCGYSVATDTFLRQTSLQRSNGLSFIARFTEKLVLHTTTTPVPYYTVQSPDESYQMMTNNTPLPVNRFALSENGSWVAMELYDKGFARLNLSTGELRRIVASNGASAYGYGRDPSYELAIANNGEHLAVMGLNGGLAIREINATCGDIVNDTTDTRFQEGVEACRMVGFDPSVFTTGFDYALHPLFLPDSRTVSFSVSAGNGYRRYLLTPVAYATHSSGSYVAFGDSFTSGEGETSDAFYQPETNIDGNKCHVSVRSYPYLIGSALSLPTTNAACSGSVTTDVLGAVASYADGNRATGAPALITLSVGGNDTGLMDKLKSCLGTDTCEWASVQRRQASVDEIRAILPSLTRLIQHTKDTFPQAAVAVVGYPSVVNTTANASCGAVNNTLLNNDEREYLEQTVRYVNQVVRAAASSTKTTYVDISNAIVGERLCESDEKGMNGIRTGDDIAPIGFLQAFKVIGAESFHPTPWAHNKIATVIKNKFLTNWPQVSCDDCIYTDSLLEPPAYWNTTSGGNGAQTSETPGNTTSRVQRREKLVDTAAAHQGDNITVALPAGSLRPGSAATIEVHSLAQEIVTTVVESDGSLHATGVLPHALVDGYHTIHVYAETPSGTALDAYQAIAVYSAAANNQSSATVSVGSTQENTPLVLSVQGTSVLSVPRTVKEPAVIKHDTVAINTTKSLADTPNSKIDTTGAVRPTDPVKSSASSLLTANWNDDKRRGAALITATSIAAIAVLCAGCVYGVRYGATRRRAQESIDDVSEETV